MGFVKFQDFQEPVQDFSGATGPLMQPGVHHPKAGTHLVS